MPSYSNIVHLVTMSGHFTTAILIAVEDISELDHHVNLL